MSGQIYQLSKYQQGCRFLQKKIEEDPKNTEIILKELVEHLIELMTGTIKFLEISLLTGNL